jgi:uncharacterized damage-inducible protein DinB
MADLRYPIGTFFPPASRADADLDGWIADISSAPAALTDAVEGLDPAQLDTPYRAGGWTVREVVHHLPDSHLNVYIRFKLALTEERPTIKPYDEVAWTRLGDVRATPVDISLRLYDALHQRFVHLLKAMSAEDFERTFVHPEVGRELPLWAVLGSYAWHGRHHVAQIRALRHRMGW